MCIRDSIDSTLQTRHADLSRTLDRLSGKADRLGSITPGKYADFVVLSDNLFAIEPAAIPDVAVWLTVFDGRVVYEEGSSAD